MRLLRSTNYCSLIAFLLSTDEATKVADSPAEGGAVEAEEFKLPLDSTAETVIRPQNSLTEKKNIVPLGE